MGRKTKENGMAKSGKNKIEVKKAVGGKAADKKHDDDEASIRGCVCPNGCIVGSPLEKDNLGAAVEFECSNEDKCSEDRPLFLHEQCWKKYEALLIKLLAGTPRARYWAESMVVNNLWTKKGYEEIFQQCRCTCGGRLKKKLHFDVNKAQQDAEEAAAKKKRKAKPQHEDLPKLNVGVGGNMMKKAAPLNNTSASAYVSASVAMMSRQRTSSKRTVSENYGGAYGDYSSRTKDAAENDPELSSYIFHRNAPSNDFDYGEPPFAVVRKKTEKKAHQEFPTLGMATAGSKNVDALQTAAAPQGIWAEKTKTGDSPIVPFATKKQLIERLREMLSKRKLFQSDVDLQIMIGNQLSTPLKRDIIAGGGLYSWIARQPDTGIRINGEFMELTKAPSASPVPVAKRVTPATRNRSLSGTITAGLPRAVLKPVGYEKQKHPQAPSQLQSGSVSPTLSSATNTSGHDVAMMKQWTPPPPASTDLSKHLDFDPQPLFHRNTVFTDVNAELEQIRRLLQQYKILDG